MIKQSVYFHEYILSGLGVTQFLVRTHTRTGVELWPGHNSKTELDRWSSLFVSHHLDMIMFVSVEVLRPSQPNVVMSSEISLPNHTFTGQA